MTPPAGRMNHEIGYLRAARVARLLDRWRPIVGVTFRLRAPNGGHIIAVVARRCGSFA
jgi:hypothetical protein